MYWDISLHTDIEIIKKTFPQLRDERCQLDYNTKTTLPYPGEWYL
ncbi:MAG: hypothetical protein ACN6O7_22020 [Sphingobacterium sp.]